MSPIRAETPIVKAICLAVVLTCSLLFTAMPAFATQGACSSHGGVDCAIGPINDQAVCNDGQLSTVLYDQMVECQNFAAACLTYLPDPQYSSQKNVLQNELNSLSYEISQLKS